MKKSTKKMIMALAIVLIFGMSTLAFFMTSFVKPQTDDFKPLTSNIVDGEIDSRYKSAYIQAGFTWIEYYYDQSDMQFTGFLESLPQSFTSPSGEAQIIVQKINKPYLNESTYVILTSPAGVESYSDTNPNMVFVSLCKLLTFRPIECGFGNQTA